MRILLLLLTFFTALPAVAEVYKSTDEAGNVIFTDQPSPGAEQIEVDEIQTIDTPETGPFQYTPPKETAPQTYTKLEITNPANDSAVRDNAGNMAVSVSLAPALRGGDQLILYMDGNQAGAGTGSQFSLTNVDRGTHSLSVAIVNQAGQELKRSPSISFSILRHSSLHSGSTVGEAPPPPPKPPVPPLTP